jgi:hypothetical protein
MFLVEYTKIERCRVHRQPGNRPISLPIQSLSVFQPTPVKRVLRESQRSSNQGKKDNEKASADIDACLSLALPEYGKL